VSRVNARTVNALLAAAACVVGLVALYVAAFHLGVTERADARVLDGFLSLRSPKAYDGAAFVASLFNLAPYAVAVLIVAGAALWRGGPRLVAAVLAIIVGAGLTTQLLKQLTAAVREPLWLSGPSWPSGHVTAATSLALCVVLIAPAVLRPYAVVAGALGVLAAGCSVLVLGSHHPSDVAGGMLMGGAWTAGTVAAFELAEQRWPSGRPLGTGATTRWLAPVAAASSVAALLVVLAAAAPLGPDLADRTTFLLGAVLLAGCAAAIPVAAATLLAHARG
jgi:membrane-associated phospholipid phosphatase